MQDFQKDWNDAVLTILGLIVMSQHKYEQLLLRDCY